MLNKLQENNADILKLMSSMHTSTKTHPIYHKSHIHDFHVDLLLINENDIKLWQTDNVNRVPISGSWKGTCMCCTFTIQQLYCLDNCIVSYCIF